MLEDKQMLQTQYLWKMELGQIKKLLIKRLLFDT